MSSLMTSVNSSITPELTSTLATHLGIAADATGVGLRDSVAVILTTLAAKAHDQSFIDEVYGLIMGTGASAASTAGSSVSNGTSATASDFLGLAFGDHLQKVEDSVALMSAIPGTAAPGVMTAAARLVLSTLADEVESRGLTPNSLGSMLAAEFHQLRSFLPAGFAIPGLAAFASPAAATPAEVAAEAEENRGVTGWLWPVLLFGAVLIAGLIWYFDRGDAVRTASDTAAQATSGVADGASKASSAVSSTAGTAISALGAFFKHKLPDGTEINIPQNGIENKLISFIEDPSRPVDKLTWFDFDRLLFATASANLEPSSTQQLTDVASIMKAYPKVEIRIGGYTDNTGDAAANMKLSEDRANNVLAELVKLGVEPARMDAKGYGDQHPVADNATEEGRAQNRRISLRVTAK